MKGQEFLGKCQGIIDTIMSPGPFVGFITVMIHCINRKPQTSGSKLMKCHPGFMENQFSLKGYHN